MQEEEEAKNNIIRLNKRKLLDEENKISTKLCFQKSVEEKQTLACECQRQCLIGKKCYKSKQKNGSIHIFFVSFLKIFYKIKLLNS